MDNRITVPSAPPSYDTVLHPNLVVHHQSYPISIPNIHNNEYNGFINNRKISDMSTISENSINTIHGVNGMDSINNYNYGFKNRGSSVISNRVINPNLDEEGKFRNIMETYNIHHLFCENLSVLKDYKIVLCVDDSSSMNEPIIDTPIQNIQNPTRYDEIKTIIRMLIDIALIYDNDGLDMYFLNKNPVFDIKNYLYIEHILNKAPEGHTPLRHITRQIFQKYKYNSKPVLLIVATDGIPTDNNGNEDLINFISCLKKRNVDNYYVSFLACSNRKEDIYYLKKLNKDIENLSVLDNYSSEKNLITNVKGRTYRYTLGDHIARLLLTPIAGRIDIIEELELIKYKPDLKNPKSARFKQKQKRVRNSRANYNRQKKNDCTIL